MNIVILGAGPAGLYCGLLLKKAHPAHAITIIERNPADVTYGWGVVFSDRTLGSFQRADLKTYEQITSQFVIWDAIDVYYRNEVIHCGGHIIASISRRALLHILQERCIELGVRIEFGREINDLAEIGEYDLLIAADGINSMVRRMYEASFQPMFEQGKAKYIWLGASKVLDAFTFIFRENEHGLFQVHAYPFSGTTSTFIVESDEQTWRNAGLDRVSEQESIDYCQNLFAPELGEAKLLSNNSKWLNFSTLKTKNWHHGNIVLLGDAVHTAHFSIGSGTKLAMEDAIALAGAIEQYPILEMALNEYELERKPVVEVFQNAAQESQTYFEMIKRYLGLEPMQFAFQLLTRSKRITYNDLRLRDAHFVETVDRWYVRYTNIHNALAADIPVIVAPAPLFMPLCLRDLSLPNRVVLSPQLRDAAEHGLPAKKYMAQLGINASGGAGLILTELTAISAEARITPEDTGMYTTEHMKTWKHIVEQIHASSSAKIALKLGHAGRRGATQPRSRGLDRPLRKGSWPLLSASPIPYTPYSQVPEEMDRNDMDRICEQFIQAAQMADEAGFDMLQLDCSHGYLLASFLSPLTNQRNDEYGGDLEHRMCYPLEVFDAVRAVWPQEKPLSVSLIVTDYMKDGFSVDDAVVVARRLKEHGCDIIAVQAGQTTTRGEPAYGHGFMTSLSVRVRNEAGIPTMVGGYLTTTNEINTILAAGRADLCIMTPQH